MLAEVELEEETRLAWGLRQETDEDLLRVPGNYCLASIQNAHDSRRPVVHVVCNYDRHRRLEDGNQLEVNQIAITRIRGPIHTVVANFVLFERRSGLN